MQGLGQRGLLVLLAALDKDQLVWLFLQPDGPNCLVKLLLGYTDDHSY